MKLYQAVGEFADLTRTMSDQDLERPWTWLSYDSDGVRFAYFRTFEDLQELAVKLSYLRPSPVSAAQGILGQYHQAYRDLEAATFSIDPALEDRSPAEGEWSVRRTWAHILGGDMNFFVHVKYAIDRYREGAVEPADVSANVSDEVWDEIMGENEESYTALMQSDLATLQEYHTDLHARILREFTEVDGELLERPSRYWEKEAMSIRFRLHRFESHMRQHTIQIDKTLGTLSGPPTETERLLRMIFHGLSQAECARIGSEEFGDELIDQTVHAIRARTREIEDTLD